MTRLSLVITASHGGLDCLAVNSLGGAIEHPDVDIIFVCKQAPSPDWSDLPRFQYVHCPNAGPLTLRRIGLMRARQDWVFVSENHCKLKPELFDAYRDAIQDNAGADLLFGPILNETSTRPTAAANFLYGYYAHWPATTLTPAMPSIANLAIRKSALRPEELAMDGGFECLTLPRLAMAGRMVYCPAPRVDHVEINNLINFCINHFHNGRACLAAIQPMLGGRAVDRARHAVTHCLRTAFQTPFRALRSLREIPSAPMLGPSLFMMGASHAVGAAMGYLFGAGDSHQKID